MLPLLLGTGWGFVSDSWELRAPCHDGAGTWSPAPAHIEEIRVSLNLFILFCLFVSQGAWSWLDAHFAHGNYSRHAEKYVRRGRLDWPEGAASRESIKAVQKLARLQNLIMQHVDHSAGDLIHLLQGLLKYDPSDRLTAREALRHSFFTRDNLRRWSSGVLFLVE